MNLHKKSPIYRKKTPLSQEIKSIYRSLIVVVVGLNIILASLLLYFGSQKATLGYTLQDLQNKNAKLMQENKIIETKIIEVRTAQTLKDSKKVKSMENIIKAQESDKNRVTYFEEGNRVSSK
ncbi:hypothetical protein HYV57_04845 [Candidatus Peregrinibacteria bacterium]|nr:hypothetical protein [Candidatus Peregrinibacteria bacterium]